MFCALNLMEGITIAHCSSMLCNRKAALWMQMDFGNCLFVTLFEMLMSTKSGLTTIHWYTLFVIDNTKMSKLKYTNL